MQSFNFHKWMFNYRCYLSYDVFDVLNFHILNWKVFFLKKKIELGTLVCCSKGKGQRFCSSIIYSELDITLKQFQKSAQPMKINYYPTLGDILASLKLEGTFTWPYTPTH